MPAYAGMTAIGWVSAIIIIVIPAKAGIHFAPYPAGSALAARWIPAFAGMTKKSSKAAALTKAFSYMHAFPYSLVAL